MSGRDITEGLPVNIGNPTVSGIWINTGETYDVAIGGEPFFLAPTDNNPYQRETAPYRKDQFDNSKEPGEQSLTGWWIRSQSSFHGGTGIKFYDPTSGESVNYRYNDSRGVDVFTKGQVTLLKNVTQGHNTTGTLRTNGRPFQSLIPIKWDTTDGVLLWDEYDLDKIDSAGTLTHFLDLSANPVYAVCSDGVNAFWITNDTSSGKLQLNKKVLTGDLSTGTTNLFTHPSIVVTNAVMEFVKDRIILCANNAVYEMATNASSLPTAVYTNPNTNYVYTSITASGPAIYTSGYSGIYSTIQKYTLSASTGSMPTLTQAITAAEFPPGEYVYKIFYYLGYMMIGTNKGVRVAVVSPDDGSLSYGPLIFESTQPVYSFAARDRFVWCTAKIGDDVGLIRIDLSTKIENESLRFAYANDLEYAQSGSHSTTAVSFIGTTNRLNFVTSATKVGDVTYKAQSGTTATLTTSSAHGLSVGDRIHVHTVGIPFNGEFDVLSVPSTTTFTYTVATSATVSTTAVSPNGAVHLTGFNYQEDADTLVSSGYLTTGAIRYGTLEPKNYKFIRARGIFTNGSMDISTVDSLGTAYSIITYNATTTEEAATLSPEGPQEYISYKFTLSRSTSNTSLGPTFKGFQAKSLPATKRQRLIQFPVWCYDVETDRNGMQTGYEGRAWERIQTLEDIEAAGDIITVQDFTTGERVQALVEKILFNRRTPPSDRYDGFGGLLSIIVRTVL